MENTYKKSKGNAGLEGVQFQVSLLVVVLLNAYRKLKRWKLSSENQDAAKFDDLILELPDKGSVLLQAKFKGTKKINKQQLLSNNSKTADFSLAKYFFSYLEIKTKFKIKSIIICTNASIDEKGLDGAVTRCWFDQDSVLYCEENNYSFLTFNDKILSELKATAKIYHKNNLQGKGINESMITDENMREFLSHLQFVYNYPSGEYLLKIIEQLLGLLNDTSLTSKISPQDVYKKVEDWFKQPKGEYLTEIRVNAIFCEIKSDNYCESLRGYNVLFENNDFNFTDSKRIYHVTSEGRHLLPVLKVYNALQKCKSKKLYVNPEDGTDILKNVISAFELRCYTHLIIICTERNEELLISQTGDKLEEILHKHHFKKVILVAEDANNLPGFIALNSNNYGVIDGFVTLTDLSRDTMKAIVQRKTIVFQGKHVSLAELLSTQTVEDYGRVIHSEILETILRREPIKVGTPPSALDDHICRYYVSRTFNRKAKTSEREETNFSDQRGGIQTCHNICFEASSTTNLGGVERGEKSEEAIPEDKIFDVNDKLILIADDAGTGKSTILTKLVAVIKRRNPYLWVIKVELNDHTKILRDSVRKGKQHLSITELLNSRDKTKFTNRLEKYVFTVSRKVVLMLDGIDEISPDYTRLVVSMLQQCQDDVNFAKILVTTRSHMVKELEEVLKVKPFVLQPFSEQNQLDFLTSYWTHNLELKDRTSKEICKRYATTLLRSISWAYLENSKENHFASLPLHLTMMAEIFQETTRLTNSTNWEGCKEYCTLKNDAKPNLTTRINLTRLYELFIEKKHDIFLDKGNPTGNTTANQALMEQFNECLVYHQNLALEVILGEDKCRYFSSYLGCDKNIETNLLKIGIVQKLEGKFHFVHRTFADYFVAKCLLIELQQNRTLEFQTFLIDTIFLHPQYNTTRIFFDSLLQRIEDVLPSDIFEKYQSSKQKCTWESYKVQSELIHILAGEGCKTILQFLLKCINFKIVTDKEINVKNFYETDLDKDVWENIFGNTLNILQHLTRQAGINIADEKGQTPLHLAARNDHLEMMMYLIEQGVNINIRTNDGDSVLCYAARFGSLSTVQYIVGLGIDINTRNNEDNTVLHSAAEYGQLDTVKFFIECGLDFNVTNASGSTLLHLAGAYGHLETVKYLLELGVKPNIRNNNGHTALYATAFYNHLDVVKILVESDQDFNVTDNYGHTVFHLAIASGQLETLKYLLDQGLDCNVKAKCCGLPALHASVRYDKLNTVKFFVEYGLDFNATNNDGRTPLHLASEQGYLDIVKYLFELGANFNVVDKIGITALQTAAAFNHLNIVKFFVEHGVDVKAKSNIGRTVLHVAVEYGRLDMIKFFFESGADFSITDSKGFSVLELSAYFGHLDILEFIAEHGLDSKIKIKYGHAMLLASKGGHLNTVKYLLEHNTGFDIKQLLGGTALHLAVTSGHLDIVKFLVESGVSVHIRDNQGRGSMQLAIEFGRSDVVEFLQELEADNYGE